MWFQLNSVINCNVAFVLVAFAKQAPTDQNRHKQTHVCHHHYRLIGSWQYRTSHTHTLFPCWLLCSICRACVCLPFGDCVYKQHNTTEDNSAEGKKERNTDTCTFRLRWLAGWLTDWLTAHCSLMLPMLYVCCCCSDSETASATADHRRCSQFDCRHSDWLFSFLPFWSSAAAAAVVVLVVAWVKIWWADAAQAAAAAAFAGSLLPIATLKQCCDSLPPMFSVLFCSVCVDLRLNP